MTKATKKTRRDLHAAINALTRDEVAEIVRQHYPRAKGEQLDRIAKAAIAEAHRLVSPRKKLTA